MVEQVEANPRFVFRGQSVEWLEAFRAKLREYLMLELDDLGQAILQTHDALSVLLALANGPRGHSDSGADGFVEEMKEALEQALAGFPNTPSFDLKKVDLVGLEPTTPTMPELLRVQVPGSEHSIC